MMTMMMMMNVWNYKKCSGWLRIDDVDDDHDDDDDNQSRSINNNKSEIKIKKK